MAATIDIDNDTLGILLNVTDRVYSFEGCKTGSRKSFNYECMPLLIHNYVVLGLVIASMLPVS